MSDTNSSDNGYSPVILRHRNKCRCRKCKVKACNCVVLASKGACSPEDDISYPKMGQLWIKDTNVMYVYQGGHYGKNWYKVPSGEILSFYFNDTQTNGTNLEVVRTFVFPDIFYDGHGKYGSWGGRILKMQYSHSWSQPVVDPTPEQGMIVILRDKNDQKLIIDTQDTPSTYEAFHTTYDILYQPNPGDVLEIVIQKPPVNGQVGEGILHCIKLFLSPFNPDYNDCHNNDNKPIV